jgi:predicted CopG family antitoxin
MDAVLEKSRINIILPNTVKDKLYKNIPSRKRSHFVSALLEEYFEKKERESLQEDLLNIIPVEPKESAVETIVRLRKGRNNPDFYLMA